MTNNLPAYRILVGYDFSEQAALALEHALALAKHHALTALHVATVVDDRHGLSRAAGSVPGLLAAEQARDELAAVVQAAVDASRPEGLALFVHARVGPPARELLRLAAESEADLVVLGTHGRTGIRKLLLGSVSGKVVRLARCPVVVVRPKAYGECEDEIELEPPCEACTARREETKGAAWWCERHARPYAPPHRYSYSDKVAIMRSDDSPIY